MKCCKVCGKELVGKPSVVSRRTYCSRSCFGKDRGFQKGNTVGIKTRLKGGERRGLGVRNRAKMDYLLHRLYCLYLKTGWTWADEDKFKAEIRTCMRGIMESEQ